MKTINKIFLTIVFLQFAISGCNDLDLYPTDQPSSETFFYNQDELILAVNSIYEDLLVVESRYISESLLDMATDISFNRGSFDGYQATARGEGNSFTPAYDKLWTRYYRGIAKANNLLDNMDKAEDNTEPETFKRINAEARYLRAFYYHRLTELYGDVPLITSSLKVDELQVNQTPKPQIVDFVLEELNEIANDLPESYSGSDMGRATKGAALALRARTALYNEKWPEAIAAAKAVMDLGIYSLHPSYRELFTYDNANSKEIIFIFNFLDGFRMHGTPRNNQSRMGGGFSQQVPVQAMVDSYECTDGLTIEDSPLYDPANPFEHRDPRLDQSIVLPGTEWAGYIFETHRDSVTTLNLKTNVKVNNQDVTNPFASFSGYLWKKYLDDADLLQLERSSINWIMTRYAEVLLTYAEAKIESNDIDQSVLEAINQVRARAYGVSLLDVANYPEILTTNQTELRSIVRRERKVELAYEGFRLFDIRRWRIAEYAMNTTLYGRPERDYAVMGKPAFDENGIPDYTAYGDKLRVIENRSFEPNRDYLWAIPQADINVNPNLDQNLNY